MEGILLVDKPAGPTSHDVVARLRRVLGTREMGHAGTLDPQATGLLVLAVGRATRWLPYLPTAKSYRATLRLGLSTDTEDIWGAALPPDDGPAPLPDAAAVRRALEGLTRLKTQVPPMVSAVKRDGRRLYELAREGLSVERAGRPVRVDAVRVLAVRGADADFEVDCGPGTYVRTLCVEAGRSLGQQACMAALRRLACGGFTLERALPEERWTPEALAAGLLGSASALGHLPERALDAAEAEAVGHGRPVGIGGAALAATWRLTREGRLLAFAQEGPDGSLRPTRVFAETHAPV